ncbi:MAG: permease-like cell division protein FtsX [Pseudomonadota bacterium]
MINKEPGARVHAADFSSRLSMYLRNHIADFKSSYRGLIKNPLSTLMTVMVLGIAMALPSGFHVLLKNSQQLTQGWDGNAKLSLYLYRNTSPQSIESLMGELRTRKEVSDVSYFSPEESLASFREESGFGEALAFLDENPLPGVIEVVPSSRFNSPREAAFLVDSLQKIPEVEMAQLDLEWLRRFHAMLDVAEQTSEILGILFGLAVVLIVGNTIRLAVQNRKEEIEIIKLVGATNSFIQRPFLYTGILYGFSAAVFAWLVVSFSINWIQTPVQNLAALYNSQYSLSGMSVRDVVFLCSSGIGLGLLGSWVSVVKHLKEIEPQ